MAAPNTFILVLRSASIPSADVIRVIGTKKNNDVPPGPTNLGVLPGVATAAAPAYVEGKQVALSTDLSGATRVIDVGGSGGVAQADLSAFTEVVTFFNPIGGERQDLTITIPNGKAGVSRLTPFRAIHVNLRDNGGIEIPVLNGQAIAPLTDRAFLVAGTDGIKDYIIHVDANGTVRVQEFQAAAASVTSVAGSAATVTLKAANAARKGLSVFNDTNKILFLKDGAGATSLSYTAQVMPNELYEMPFPMFTGEVTGVWSIGVIGNALVTELS